MTGNEFRSILDKVYQKYSAKTALVRIGENEIRDRITYGELKDGMDVVQRIFAENGIAPRKRITVLAPHSAELSAFVLGMAYNGFIPVMLDTSLPDSEIERLVTYAEVDAVVTTKELYEKGLFQQEDMTVFALGTDFFECSVVRAGTPKEHVTKNTDNVMAILFSSGTTGEMKGIEITYESIVKAQEYMAVYTNLTSEISFMNVLPQNHIAGFSTMFSCYLAGAEMGFIEKVDAEHLSKGFIVYQPTNFIMIPKIYDVIKEKIQAEINKKNVIVCGLLHGMFGISGIVRKLTGIKLRGMMKPIFSKAFGNNLVICGCGAGMVSEGTVEFYLKLGIDFVNVYGATETGFPITAVNCHTDKYCTVGAGKYTQFPEITIKIAEPNEEQIGEIRLKSPLLMHGYFKEPELTAAAYDGEGYFKTGDYGYINEKDMLVITGRMKESILLKSGKKVSPIDVERYYGNVSELPVTVCGVTVEDGTYDEVHLFVEKGSSASQSADATVQAIKSLSLDSVKGGYRLDGVHVIDKIPVTTMGKPRRYMLQALVAEEKAADEQAKSKNASSGFGGRGTKSNVKSEGVDGTKNGHTSGENSTFVSREQVLAVIEQFCGVITDANKHFISDLGLDSLAVMELSIALEEETGCKLSGFLMKNPTVEEVLSIVTSGEEYKEEEYKSGEKVLSYEAEERDRRWLRKFTKVVRRLYNVKTEGMENIQKDENYIFCPNHESYFDALYVAGTFNGEREFYTMAACELFQKKLFQRGLHALGGIAIDRVGDNTEALLLLEEKLKSGSKSVLIHPEGTRSRTGELGAFKTGAAKLAQDTGVKLVPVRIDGAYEIYPPNKQLPRLFDFKHCKKYELRITFGTPIDARGKTAEEVMEEVRGRIVGMEHK